MLSIHAIVKQEDKQGHNLRSVFSMFEGCRGVFSMFDRAALGA